jgi:hypothetical protein
MAIHGLTLVQQTIASSQIHVNKSLRGDKLHAFTCLHANIEVFRRKQRQVALFERLDMTARCEWMRQV